MLSQLGYLGCIISPNARQMAAINEIFLRFVKGRLNIARNRIFCEAEDGGLGMIHPETYIKALQTTWFKRAYRLTADIWSQKIWNNTNGNPLIASPAHFSPTNEPILFNLSVTFYEFRMKFFGTGKNVLKSNILHNPILHQSINNKSVFQERSFGADPDLRAALAGLKVCDLSTDLNLKSLDTLELDTGLHINLVTYLRLEAAFFALRMRYRSRLESNATPLSTEEFFRSFKKG